MALDETSYAGWVLAGIGTIVATLSGIVARFYQQQVKAHADEKTELKSEITVLRTRADKCDSEREELRIKYAVLESKYTTLEHRVADLEEDIKGKDAQV